MALLADYPLTGDGVSADLNDYSGNGYHLTGIAQLAPSLVYNETGIVDAAGAPRPNRTEAALRLTGAMSFIAMADCSFTNVQYMVGCGGSGELSANNDLYAFGVGADGANNRCLRYVSENGAGVNSDFQGTVAGNMQMVRGRHEFVGFTRSSDGTTVILYRGDSTTLYSQTSGTLTAPDGGGSSVFRLMALGDGNSPWLGGLERVKVFDHVLTGAEMETYRAAYFLTGVEGSSDATPPTVSGVTPSSPGTVAQADNVAFDVTDGEDTVAMVTVDVAYADGSTESIYNGEAFSAAFNAASSIGVITGGFGLDISRDDGWQQDFTLHIAAVDTSGNTVFEDLTYTLSDPPTPAAVVFDPVSTSTITRFQSVDLDITDDVSVSHSTITAEFTDGTYEVVFDGSSYADGYSSSSTTPISGGTTYTVARDGGWLAGLTLRARVLDSDDNITTASATYTVTSPTPSADSTLPVITITSPTPGSDITIDTPLVGTITDDTLLAKFMLAIRFPILGRTELAWNGTSWQLPYSSLSSLSAISGGFNFSIRRTGGWPVPEDPNDTEEPELLIYAVDGDGNEGL